MKNIIKSKKGITLVALIVTIILLLILAGITISQLSGSGLFENAKLAEQKSKEAKEKEEGILDAYENLINGQIASSNRDDEVVKELRKEIEELENELNNLKLSINQTDATASDILSGKVAYTKEGLLVGTSNNKYTEEQYDKNYFDGYTAGKNDNCVVIENFTLDYNNGNLKKYSLNFKPSHIFFVNEDYYIWGTINDTKFYYNARSNNSSGFIENAFYAENDGFTCKLGDSSATGTLYAIK